MAGRGDGVGGAEPPAPRRRFALPGGWRERPERAVALALAGVAAIAVLGVLGLRSTFSADATSSLEVNEIPVSGAPSEIAVAGGRVWTLDLPARRLRALDPTTGEQVGGLTLGGPASYATSLAAGAGAVWVSLGDGAGGGVIARVDPATFAAHLTRLPRSIPERLVVGARSLWVLGSDRLSRTAFGGPGRVPAPDQVQELWSSIDLAVGYGSAWAVTQDTAGGRIGGSRLVRIDETSGAVVLERSLGGASTAVAVGAGAVWIANGCAQGLVRMPVRAGGARCVEVDAGLTDLAVGGGGVWGADHDGSALVELDARTGRVRSRAALPARPSGVALGLGAVWAVSEHGAVYRLGEAPARPGAEV